MNLSDDELSALYGMLEEWVQSSEYFTDEDSEAKSSMFAKVCAMRRSDASFGGHGD